ncbi:hypothetical protein [Actinophytocola sediminis]
MEVRHDLAAIRDSKNPGVTMTVNRAALIRLTIYTR